jgi:hypothetical protein
MHHKDTFALAGVFLAVALVLPIALFALQASNDIIIIQNPTGMDTDGSLPTAPVEQVQQSHVTTLLIVIFVEIIFVSLFIVAIYYGIRHIHPNH